MLLLKQLINLATSLKKNLRKAKLSWCIVATTTNFGADVKYQQNSLFFLVHKIICNSCQVPVCMHIFSASGSVKSPLPCTVLPLPLYNMTCIWTHTRIYMYTLSILWQYILEKVNFLFHNIHWLANTNQSFSHYIMWANFWYKCTITRKIDHSRESS